MEELYFKKDQRIVRTQKAIITAFYELLASKNIADISVKEICDKADVNRGTFYTHFEDKYHLLDYCIYELMKDVDVEITKASNDKNIIDYYEEVFEHVVTFFIEQKTVAKSILTQSSALILDDVRKHLTTNAEKKIRESIASGVKYTVPVEFLTQYFVGGVISSVKAWIFGELNMTKNEITHYLNVLLRTTLYDTTIRPRTF